MLKHILILTTKQYIHNMSFSFTDAAVNTFNRFNDILEYIKYNNTTKEELIIISDSIEIISKAISYNLCTIGYEHDNIDFSSVKTNLILGFDDISYSYLDSILCHFYNLPWKLADLKEIEIIEPIADDFNKLYNMYANDNTDKQTYLSEYMTLDYLSEKDIFISYVKNQFIFYGYGLYNIIYKSNNELIGQCGLYNDNDDRLCISYYIKPTYRKMNMAYTSCTAIIEYVKKELYVSKIYAHIHDNNIASIHLALKLGFIKETPSIYVLYINNKD